MCAAARADGSAYACQGILFATREANLGMCRTAGVTATVLPDRPCGVVRRMLTALRYRGPDAEGEYLDAHAALGACRLSIVDLGGGRSSTEKSTTPARSARASSSVRVGSELRALFEHPASRSGPRHHAAPFHGQ